MQFRDTSAERSDLQIARLEAQVTEQQSALAEQQVALEQERARLAQLQSEYSALHESYSLLLMNVELLRRRIFLAKAERVDTHQLEIEFANKLADLNALKGNLPFGEPVGEIPFDGNSNPTSPPDAPAPSGGGHNGGPRKNRKKPKGRRSLADCNLQERRIEVPDEAFEELVKQGKAERIGTELSYRLGFERGGHRKIVIARVTYRAKCDDGSVAIATTPMPKQTLPGVMAAPSKLAYVIHQKFGMGLPFFRLEAEFKRIGVSVDRGTLCRWAQEVGATVGASIVEAMRQDALANAFCIATDATGVAVLPAPHEDGRRQACKRGHFFVQIADRDHVFFEYVPRETSAAVAEWFRGFTGYVQADAKSVFDILFRPRPDADADADADDAVSIEVGCMAHCRRRYWEAAVTLKSPIAREGLYRLRRIYQLEAQWKNCTPEERHRLRNIHLKPELDAFFVWAEAGHESEKNRRGPLRSAFGYTVRHKQALSRFLDDGRLRIDNNESERNVKLVALGRRAWLFVGSDDHGTSTGHLLTLIASARLHGLDAEQYLRDMLRVLCHWPQSRNLELAPKNWAQTRARLDATQLAAEYGRLDIPPAIFPDAAKQ